VQGTAIGTIVNNNGTAVVEFGGVATGTIINGGTQYVLATASNTTINSGIQVVEGGTASNTTINGGVEYVYAGGTANGVTFGSPAGTLLLEQPASLTGTISGWQVGDAIDFEFTAITSAAISGSTLQITVNGGQSFSYQLAGRQTSTVVQIQNDRELRLVEKLPPPVTEALAHDTGVSSTDNITFDPTLTGSGDPNATVHFTIDGTPITATATADAAGNWSYTPIGLADGSHTIVASETDAAENTATASLTFALDSDKDVMPSFVVAGGAPIIGIVNLKAVSFTVGGLEDESGTAWFSDGNSTVIVPVGGNGTFTVDLSGLARNQIISFLSVGDVAGNNFTTTGNTITADPGPSAGSASIMVAAGTTTDLTGYLLGLDKPGIAGDNLTLSGNSTAGTKGTVMLANGLLTYAAPTTLGSDSFGYTVADQYGDTASALVTVAAVNIGNIGNASGTIVVGDNSTGVGFGKGTVTVLAGNGNDAIAGGGTASDTVIAGNGNDTVSLGQGNNTVILGSGNDSVTVGDGNNTITIVGSANSTDTIKAGSGNNTLYLGAGHETVSLGNGNNTLILTTGTYDVSAGKGTDLFVFAGPQALLDMSFASNDELVFRATGFDLGADNGLGTGIPQPVAASLFSSHTDGTFATPDNRFAYNASTGVLYYDAPGSTPGSIAFAIADLTNHPHLSAANLFFTS
jgi:autotransporter passenger strand-loop-strand repeat protein